EDGGSLRDRASDLLPRRRPAPAGRRIDCPTGGRTRGRMTRDGSPLARCRSSCGRLGDPVKVFGGSRGSCPRPRPTGHPSGGEVRDALRHRTPAHLTIRSGAQVAPRLLSAASLTAGILALLLGTGPFAPRGHGQQARTPKDDPKAVPLVDRLRSPYEAD